MAEKKKENIFGKIMTFRYVFALSILAILAISSYKVLGDGIKDLQGDAYIINISGRQRMLTQRIALFSLRLVNTGDKIERQKLRKEIFELINLIDDTHQILLHPRPDDKYKVKISKQTKAIYFSPPIDLHKKIHIYIDRTKALVNTLDTGLTKDNKHLSNILAASYNPLIDALDAMVLQYQLESEERVNRLQNLEITFLGIGMLTLLFTALFIFRPLAHRVQAEINRYASAQEALRRANQVLSAIIQSSPLPIFSLSPEGEVLSWNPAATRIFGWNKQEALNKILPIVPEDKFDEFRMLRERILAGGRLDGVEVIRRKKDGSPIDLRIFAAPLYDNKNKITGIMAVVDDITERKQAAMDLRRSEENYRILVENLPDCICQISLTGKFISMNASGCEINGFEKPEDVIGKSCSDFVVENRQGLEEALKRTEKGETVSVQYKSVNKKGREIWWDAKITPLRDQNGVITSLLRVSRNITERIEAQERQKATISGLRTIMSIADEIVLSRNTDTLLKTAVEEARKKLGLERCAIFLETNGYMQGTYGTNRYGQTTNEYSNRFPKKGAWEEHAHVMKSGEAQWFVVKEPYLEWDGAKSVPVDGEGWIAVTPIRSAYKIIGVFVNDTAISRKRLDAVQQEILAVFSSLLGNIIERRHAEEGLFKESQFNEGLLRTIPFGMDIVDAEGNILYINEAFKKLVGGDARGKKCFYVYKDNKEQCGYCPLKRGIEVGKTEVLETSGALGARTYRITHTGMMYQDKKAVLEIFEDITQKKEAEQRLREAIVIKSEFVSMVSHELRTPLTAIKEGIAIVADESAGKINPEQKNFLDIAERNVRRLSRFINNVLDYQKLDSGRMEFFMHQQDINQAIKETSEDIKMQVVNKGLELKLELADNLPFVIFDKDKIMQVLANLLYNAIKFTKNGYIKISTLRIDDAIRIGISDTGIGIKREDVRKLFQDFSQLATGKERKTGSTGLGLAICRKVILRHGGQIWVESEFGKGSTFYFTLPIK